MDRLKLKSFILRLIKLRNWGDTLKLTKKVDTLSIRSGPVIKINSPSPSETAINLGPLICRQMLIPRPECQFELRSDKDRIRLKLFNLRKKATKSTASSTLSISFRTSKPNGRLLELLDGGNGPLGALDLVDGYLLFSNHIVHPSKLLADGLWHTIHLHLHSLSVRIDNLGTSLSLRETSDFGEPKWIDILVHGEVAAFRILDNSENDGGEDQWICNDLESGLILFGVFSPPISPANGQQKVLLNGGGNLGRIQVHFVDNKVFASQCLLLADGSEKSFGSDDQWTRISLFHQLGNNFMSVDDLVCVLSPNSAVVDSSELYRITAKNFLFVGGTFYAKNILLNKIISERFKKDFQDNTKEKAPSLESQNSQQQQFNNQNGKLTSTLILEKEPLNLNEKSEKDLNDNLINKKEEAPPRPPKNTSINLIQNNQNLNEKQSNGIKNEETSSPLISIRPLESSPRKKQIFSNGREGGANTPPSPLRMTPLRPQQQLKNGNSQQNFVTTATTTDSFSSSPPPLPPPSTFYSDRSLSKLAPTSNNSILSSSPISELTSSSISPSGDSLRDSELMRPPNIKIISSINSTKRHSPIDSIAAPIACKEEL
uniref:Laminin G domain-containing protein n=1 Tax=Meloidogyne javanica TaxID=6303 RepID=A0A915N461_MELJA